MRAAAWWRFGEGVEDGLPDGRHHLLREWPGTLFSRPAVLIVTEN